LAVIAKQSSQGLIVTPP